jgi:hypothetical protein
MPRTSSDHLLYGRVTGEIPQEIIDKKYEQTIVYESPDLVNNYFRETLRDQSADPDNTFASGGKRNNGGYSEEEIALAKKQGIDLPKISSSPSVLQSTVLNIRSNGGRSQIQPRHSEAFFELTGADPRGHSNLPDFNKIALHSRIRAKDRELNFSNDDDYTVTESARHPAKVSSDKKMAINAAKQKLQIFNESETSWGANSGNLVKSSKTKSDVDRVLLDGNTLDITDQSIENRRSNVTTFSNALPGGWHQVTDHKVATGKYTKVYSGYAKAVDLNKNRSMVQLDGPKYVSKENRYLPTSVIALMNKQTKSRLKYQDTLPPSNKFWGKSMDTEGFTAGKGHAETVQEKVRLGLQGAVRHKDRQVAVNGKTQKLVDGQVDRFIGEQDNKMTRAMKKAVENVNKSIKTEIKDIREQIEQTQHYAKSQIEQIKKGSTATFKGHNFDDTVIYNKSGLKVEVKQYKNPMIIHKGGVNTGNVYDDEKGVMVEDLTLIRKPNHGTVKLGDSYHTVDTSMYKDVSTMDKHRKGGPIKTERHFSNDIDFADN